MSQYVYVSVYCRTLGDDDVLPLFKWPSCCELRCGNGATRLELCMHIYIYTYVYMNQNKSE